jgi:hypothetical protein
VRYSETPAGQFRAAFGIGDQDVTAAAKQLLDTSELEHRSKYGSAPAPRRWPFEAAVAAVAAESGSPWVSVTSAELAARMRLVDPLHPWGVIPDYASAQIIRPPSSRG